MHHKLIKELQNREQRRKPAGIMCISASSGDGKSECPPWTITSNAPMSEAQEDVDYLTPPALASPVYVYV